MHNTHFIYSRSNDQIATKPVHHPVIIVGAGPVGLASAIDLAQRGIRVIVLDDDDTLSTGSRAICFAKHTLEYFDKLGVGDRAVEKGVIWNKGRVFYKDAEVYSFDLQAEEGHKRPAFINLQQYYVEEYLITRALALNIEIRWKNKVMSVTQHAYCASLTIDTPDGGYHLLADWVIAADGAKSGVRNSMGLKSEGVSFDDKFLIADIHMKADFPSERWFWFDPPFHPGQSVLLHKQPDDIWRVDFQLGRDADVELEKSPERVLPRLKALLGARDFTLTWVSVYSFRCTRMARFLHGNVIFIGDAAHGVSPFGARGANSGLQDAEGLAWRLAKVLQGGDASLLEDFNEERSEAADENILQSTNSTQFISPQDAESLAKRNAILEAASIDVTQRPLINSGRLSVPTHYKNGYKPVVDAPFNGGWFMDVIGGDTKTVCFTDNETQADIAVPSSEKLLWARYKAHEGMVIEVRADRYYILV
jgi:3-(3-hydroxy-phenyl)propionate hydroxylase